MRIPRSKDDVLRRLIVSIDGPSGSGKTTTARAVARKLAFQHLDTGAMYRAVTLLALRDGHDMSDGEEMGRVAAGAEIHFEESNGGQRVLVNGTDVSEAIRTPEVTANVSQVSAHPSVRRAMVGQQRALSDAGGVVLEGRDIGTVVLPHAEVKIYLDASIDVRAKRRMKEFRGRGVEKDLAEVRAELAERDHKDSNRPVSPLKVPIGAVTVDTSELTIDEQVGRVVSVAQSVASHLFELPREPRPDRARPRRRHFRFVLAQGLIRWIMRLIWGVRIVRKSPFEFRENYIFAANHRSYSDPPFIGSTIPRNVRFLAKATLFDQLLFGWLIRTFNAIPLRRRGFDRAALDHAIELLGLGDSVLVFPEGRRVPGEALGEARAGVGYLAVRSGYPVLPIYAHGTHRLLGGLVRRPRLTIIHGRPIRFTGDNLDSFRSNKDFREFGDMVMRAIQALKDEYDAGVFDRGGPPRRGT